MVHVDVEQSGRPRDQRFQINHHAYRLQQSACFIRSEGRMGCTSCHDPHVKHTGGADPAHFRDRCLQCHGAHAPDDALPRAQARRQDVAIDACPACHMPRRRTQDVVLATMTDHRIARGPFDLDQLTAPLAPGEPRVDGITLLQSGSVAGAEGEAYRALAALRAGAGAGALAHLEAHLERIPDADPGWWYALARHQVDRGQFGNALQALARTGEAAASFPGSGGLRAHALLGLGRTEEAQRIYAAYVEPLAFQPEDHFNRGLAWRAVGEHEKAAQAFRSAVALRPLLAVGWYQLGVTERSRGRLREARDALEQALRIHPAMEAARAAVDALEDP
jgi:hypothetical protein